MSIKSFAVKNRFPLGFAGVTLLLSVFVGVQCQRAGDGIKKRMEERRAAPCEDSELSFLSTECFHPEHSLSIEYGKSICRCETPPEIVAEPTK